MTQLGSVVHSFNEDNEFSQSAEVQVFLDRFYVSAFPNMSRHEFETDPKKQAAGIDRTIYLIGGDVIHVDEKIRREHYNDFALEYLSNDQTGAVGWMNKDLDIDYIVYAWLETRDGYVLNYSDLTKAWALCGDGWLKNHRHYHSKNSHYNTWFVAIPKHRLLSVVDGQYFKVK